MRPLFNAWRDVAVVHGAGGLADAVAGGAISRSAGMAIEGTDLPSQPKPLPKGSPPPPAGRDQVPFKAPPMPRPAKKPPPNAPPKKPPPLRPPPFKAPPQEVQIRRTNSPPTMKSPPMAPSLDDESPLAAAIPEDLSEDEPSTSTFTSTSTSTGRGTSTSSTRPPTPLPSRSQSWPVRRERFTRWPFALIFFEGTIQIAF